MSQQYLRLASRARAGMTAMAVVALLVVGLAVGSASASAAVGPPVVSTTSGSFQGAAPNANGIAAFKGMPYAAPPVGAFRWRPPQPVHPASGVQSATQFGNACLAAPGPDPNPNDAKIPQSEDCLTANVWTPSTRTSASKPVMVWIHGGGFEFGSSALPTYDGSLLAAQGVVVVSLNYRLGVFGFLGAPQFDAESGSSGAWGLQDQQAALRWVQSNITQFGGDPRNVTLFGESAGAHSVGMLMTSPHSPGLFSRAIMESGATWDTEHGSIDTHQEALAKGNQFVTKFAGQDMRSVPADVINAAAPWDYTSDPTITAFTPSIDGDVLTDSPMNVFANGKQMDIPILGGWNGAEWFPFEARAIPAAPPQVFYDAAGKLFGQQCLPQFQSLYPPSDATNAEASSLQLDGDMGIAQQTWEALHRQSNVNNSYAYRFTYTSPYSPVPIHTAEVPFVFGTLTRQPLGPTATPAAADRQLSATMMAYWTNFARKGNPNGPGLPNWPTIGQAGSRVLQLDANPATAVNPDLGRFQFIEKYRQNGRFPDEWRALGSPYLTEYQGPACPTTPNL